MSPLCVLASHPPVTDKKHNSVTLFCLPHSRLYTLHIVQAGVMGYVSTKQLKL